MTEFSAYLYKHMIERNLKSNQLAKLSGVSSSEVSRLLSGERKRPNPEILRKMAPILRIPYSEIIEAAYPVKPGKNKIRLNDEHKIKQLVKDVAEFSIKEFTQKYLPKSLKFIPVLGYVSSNGQVKEQPGVVPGFEDSDMAVIAGSGLEEKEVRAGDIIFIKNNVDTRENLITLAKRNENLFIGLIGKDKNSLVDGTGKVICEDIDEILGTKVGLFRKG